MIYQDFLEKYMGEKVDWDKAFGAQCVDLARQYFEEVWGATRDQQPEGVVGAQDFANHISRPKQRLLCNWTPAVPGLLPPVGSVVVMRAWPANRFGHIGICHDADKDIITLFDQDGFKQDGAKLTRWRYDDRVAGWLTKKDA